MPSLSELPDGLPRKKFLRALQALGWEISEIGGKGSHYKATWPPTQKIIIVQYDFRKDVLYKVLKAVEQISGHTWNDIRDKL